LGNRFYVGTFGLFFTCFFLFAKYFPTIAVAEIKYVLKTSGENYKGTEWIKLKSRKWMSLCMNMLIKKLPPMGV
jgi:hypothetical protein